MPYSENPPFESRAVAITRAIENGVSLLRPTGKGISLVTDNKGRILGSQDYFASTTGIMITSLPIQGATRQDRAANHGQQHQHGADEPVDVQAFERATPRPTSRTR